MYEHSLTKMKYGCKEFHIRQHIAVMPRTHTWSYEGTKKKLTEVAPGSFIFLGGGGGEGRIK
jgi:hypothetical protein